MVRLITEKEVGLECIVQNEGYLATVKHKENKPQAIKLNTVIINYFITSINHVAEQRKQCLL